MAEYSSCVETKSHNISCSKNIKITCHLLKKIFRDFYGNIYVPFRFFRKGKWQVYQVLEDNMDALYYCDLMDEPMRERFNSVFSEYMEMIQAIFDVNGKLNYHMMKWATIVNDRVIEVQNSVLYDIITKRKYSLISPAYMIELTYVASAQRKTANKVTTTLQEDVVLILDGLVADVKKDIVEFRTRFDKALWQYVYLQPIEPLNDDYSIQFLRKIIGMIIDFAEKMIKCHIYAIHGIVEDVIESSISLDYITGYDANYNNGIVIVTV